MEVIRDFIFDNAGMLLLIAIIAFLIIGLALWIIDWWRKLKR